MDGSSVDDDVSLRADILSLLGIVNPDPFGLKRLRHPGLLRIRTGDGESFFDKNGRQSAHGNPADPDKMDMAGMNEINLIHDCETPSLRLNDASTVYAIVRGLEIGERHCQKETKYRVNKGNFRNFLHRG